MGSILVVEDRLDIADGAVAALQNNGYVAESVVGNDTGALYDAMRLDHFDAAKLATLERGKWDVLLLDINLPRDQWGGVFLYNKLASSHRVCWEHTIVFSVYAPSDKSGSSMLSSKTEEDGASFILRVFADTAGIPSQSVLSNKIGKFVPVIKRIQDLGVLP